MKQILTLLIAVCLVVGLNAQKVPDFTVTDINGNKHSLYADYLDKGKTVILDFSTTRCGPCWFIHNTNVLKDVYKVFGPDGTDEVMVLFIESDPTTTLDDLKGPTNNSFGDWVTGTPFPIINLDDNTITSAFGISGYPTIPVICPDGKISTPDLYQAHGAGINLEKVIGSLLPCLPSTTTGKDVQLLEFNGVTSTCDNLSGKLTIMNRGDQAVESFDMIVKSNGAEIYSKTITANIPSKGLIYFDMDKIDLDLSVQDHNIEIIVTGDDNDLANKLSLKVDTDTKKSDVPTYKLTINADEYSVDDNFNVQIFNSVGKQVFSSGTIEKGLYEKTIVLTDIGCHKLVMADGTGDGNGGAISLISESSDTIVNFPTQKLFSLYEQKFYNSSLSANELTTVIETKIVPSITSTFASLQFDSKVIEPITVVLTNSLGGQVHTIFKGNSQLGENRYSIDMNSLAAGMYFVSIHGNTGVKTLRLIKQ